MTTEPMTQQLSLLADTTPGGTTGPAYLRTVITARMAERDEAMRRARVHATPGPDGSTHASDPFFVRANVQVARTRNHMALRSTRALRRMEVTR